ncbi:hypothetical protein [Marinobacter sp. CHS3-4]|uniref:hypothetical protein n=1 Tax=Marinobacter sp. CHS3-4 TaxID=3045174 RepID=UPI0024B4EE6A|nr:hypothetical protein [Marinobacter sp. CHS3-4]MDI9245701.1 hypothetical protein [Marinobacter sp. CHS3-4]
MDTTMIVLLLAAIVTVSIVLIIASQMRERARIERARKITSLEDRYKRANRLLSELPGQYLTNDLKLLLVRNMEDTCRALIALRAGSSVSSWQASVAEQRQKIENNDDQRPPVKIDSPDKSTYVQELLQNLFKLIEGMHKSGQIDGPTAKKNLKFVLFLVHKTHADLHVFQARDYVKQNQIRKAIHAYHLASTEMGKSRDNPMAVKAVKSFRTRIKELESLEQGETAQASAEGQSKLDREWDNFLHDDEWRKKADYDD